MDRIDYQRAITTKVRERLKDKSYSYKKNDAEMRRILSRCGCDEDIAIRWAEKQANKFDDTKYHKHNPCTTVYKLVRLLIGKDKEFNKKIKNLIEEK